MLSMSVTASRDHLSILTISESLKQFHHSINQPVDQDESGSSASIATGAE